MGDIMKNCIDGTWVALTFSDVINDMTIACEGIFGPFMSPIAYETVGEAISGGR